MDGIELIPNPIGERFCHVYQNGTTFHHESEWKMTDEGIISVCECGRKAKMVNMDVNEFHARHVSL